jgi:pSer/pThr/pTyr-binding forkhead associated (FHA) protein
VITIILLHPLQSIPVQKWTFESNSIIKIGRANGNDIVLYSAVVSRRHLEIEFNGVDWILINKGANGTFVNGKKIDKVIVRDGMVFRLAGSGPQIQIRLGDIHENELTEPTLLEKKKRRALGGQKYPGERELAKEQFFVTVNSSIITSFCARIYGQRRSKRKTEKLISELKKVNKEDNLEDEAS